MKPRILLTGAGGHAKVVLDILEQQAEFEIAGCTAPDPSQGALGYPVIGTEESLPGLFQSGIAVAFPAIGDNQARRRNFLLLSSLGFTLTNVLSPQATISPRASLGRGVLVMPGAVVNAGAHLGDGAIVNTGALIDHDCEIGPYSHIAPGCALAGGVHIGEGAFLGVGTRVIPGVRIGAWTIVGAGGVVIRNLEPGVTAVGVPVRVIGRRALPV